MIPGAGSLAETVTVAESETATAPVAGAEA
jgi:hypothetical protein